jgi:hypothetical protein
VFAHNCPRRKISVCIKYKGGSILTVLLDRNFQNLEREYFFTYIEYGITKPEMIKNIVTPKFPVLKRAISLLGISSFQT